MWEDTEVAELSMVRMIVLLGGTELGCWPWIAVVEHWNLVFSRETHVLAHAATARSSWRVNSDDNCVRLRHQAPAVVEPLKCDADEAAISREPDHLL